MNEYRKAKWNKAISYTENRDIFLPSLMNGGEKVALLPIMIHLKGCKKLQLTGNLLKAKHSYTCPYSLFNSMTTLWLGIITNYPFAYICKIILFYRWEVRCSERIENLPMMEWQNGVSTQASPCQQYLYHWMIHQKDNSLVQYKYWCV